SSAIRSLTEPPGLKYSTLASTSGGSPSATRRSRTSGVLPTRSTTDSAYRTAMATAFRNGSTRPGCRSSTADRLAFAAGGDVVAKSSAVRLADDVWRIPTSVGDLVNTFALRDPDGSVTLVDAGLRWSGSRRILAGLAAVGIRPADVTRIVVTHAHVDHAGGLARLVAATGALGTSPERDAIYLREGRTPRTDRSTRTARIAARLTPRKLPRVPVAEEVAHGTVLPVAGGLRVVHTPGHTPGHVSLLHEPSGVLICGDAVFNVRGLRWPPSWLCTDPTRNRRSADVLGDLDYEVAAFTHGPEVRHQAREAVRAFLRGRER